MTDDFSLCVLANARKAARAVSRHYDRFVRTVGMTAGQFSVLITVQTTPGLTTADLAGRLSMERTTLLRNIAILERRDLVATDRDGGDRSKRYRLTQEGGALLDKVVPMWRQAQADVRALLGDDDFEATVATLKRLSQI